MEYHPKEILWAPAITVAIVTTTCCSLCCAYLALKVEEYNLNVDQFVHVLMTELRAPAAEMILSYEVGSLLLGVDWGVV